MQVNVVILSKSDTIVNISRTIQTIQTLHDSEDNHTFKIYLVETLPDQYTHYSDYAHCYIYPNEPFNYNRFLNMAFEHMSSEAKWVLISNNDVRYERHWFSEILKVHEIRPDIQSFSPKEPALYAKYFDGHFLGHKNTYFENYLVSEGLMGWSLLIHSDALEKIKPFDEQFDMYYQDNDYAEMLKQHGIKHALAQHSIAIHHGTFEKVNPSQEQIMKMKEGMNRFIQKWPKYE